MLRLVQEMANISSRTDSTPTVAIASCHAAKPSISTQIEETRRVSIYLLSCRPLEPRLDKHLTFTRISDLLYVKCIYFIYNFVYNLCLFCLSSIYLLSP